MPKIPCAWKFVPLIRLYLSCLLFPERKPCTHLSGAATNRQQLFQGLLVTETEREAVLTLPGVLARVSLSPLVLWL